MTSCEEENSLQFICISRCNEFVKFEFILMLRNAIALMKDQSWVLKEPEESKLIYQCCVFSNEESLYRHRVAIEDYDHESVTIRPKLNLSFRDTSTLRVNSFKTPQKILIKEKHIRKGRKSLKILSEKARLVKKEAYFSEIIQIISKIHYKDRESQLGEKNSNL